jgi:succinoglycan biosynthesis transport protein ExoP
MDPSNNDFPLQDSYAPSAVPAIDVRATLWTLRREWWFPVFGCLIGLTLAIFYIVSTPTPYKSSARILLDRSMNRYLESHKIIDEPTFDEQAIGSQVYLLSSDSVVVPVVRSMNLARDVEFVGEPNTRSTQRFWSISKLKTIVKRSIGWNDDAKAIIDPDAVLERTAVDAVIRRLSVSRGDVSNVIDVTFESQDPNKAARMANAIADTYIATTLESKYNSTQIVGQWLRDRLAELKTQVTDGDRALQDYKIAHNLVTTGKGGLLSSEQLANLSTQLTKARIEVVEAKARLDRIQQLSTRETGVLTTPIYPKKDMEDFEFKYASNSDLVKLRSQYRELAAQLTEIESRYRTDVGPGHSDAIKLREQMAGLRALIREEQQRIVDSYASELQVAKERESGIIASMAQSVGEAEKSSPALVTMRELESSAATLRDLYDSFLQKVKELNIIQTQTIPIQSASIITRAVPPLHKSARKAAAVLAGSMMLGLFLGAGTAVAREWAAGVFRSPKAVEQVTDLHCVVLPMVKAKREQTAWFGRTKRMLIEELVLDAPYSRFTEAVRDVKASIDMGQVSHGAKVIGVVSSVSKEGKTTIAANFGALLTGSSGARTLIIDADLHLRRLTANLAPDAREGLIEALDDPSRLATLVCKRQRSGLDVLPCALSNRVPNAADLLGSPKMEQLLLAARKTYDYIIIEIAPIMSVVDVKMIERFIDGYIFVVEWGQTKRRLVQEALSEAPMIRERLIAIVLNKADPSALRSIEAYKGDRFNDYYEEIGTFVRRQTSLGEEVNGSDPVQVNRLSHLMLEFPGSAHSRAGQDPIGDVDQAKVPPHDPLAAKLTQTATTASSGAVEAAKPPIVPSGRRPGARVLPIGFVLCLVGGGLLIVAGKPELGTWVKPLWQPAGEIPQASSDAIAPAVSEREEPPRAEAEPGAQAVREPAKTAPPTRISEPSPAALPAPTAPMPEAPAPIAGPGLSATETAGLVARGDAFMRARDVGSARLFYERAAEAGDGRAALRMGQTFDPAFLVGIRGTQASRENALSWYRRARDLGDAEAQRMLEKCEPQ